jgi:hypothetical protein
VTGGHEHTPPDADADLREEIRIDAPPATVWRVLTDVEGHRRWNTLFRLSGELTAGARPRVRLRVPGLPPVTTRPRVTAAEFPELVWATRLPGLRAEHVFRLLPAADGEATLFRQLETFEGPLAGQVRRLDRPILRGFEQFNRGLRRHAEREAARDR